MHISRFLMMSVASLTLAACASMGGVSPNDQSIYDDKINAALSRAADQAGREGQSAGSLVLLEKLYKREPDNVANALKYGHALRLAGEADKAALVMKPFADRPDASADILTEYAMVQIDAAKYAVAENYARKAVAKDPAAYRAYQVMGIAQDAQMKYKDAEVSFRKGLDLWKGDPIPVMNNLALNLTNQERLSEALDIMEQAKAAAPDRVEVERNLRIIRTLSENASGRPAPKPGEKPTPRPASVTE